MSIPKEDGQNSAQCHKEGNRALMEGSECSGQSVTGLYAGV